MKRTTKRILYNVLLIGLLIGALCYALSKFVHPGVEYTDNATVCRHIIPVHVRVQGFVKRICFDDFHTVRKGDTLLIVEDTEYRLRLAQAEADLAQAEAGQRAAGIGVVTADNSLRVDEAAIAEVRVHTENARRELERYEHLLAEGAVTRQQYDQVRTAAEAAEARYRQVLLMQRNTSLSRDAGTQHLGQSEAALRVAQAAVELARLQLGYCVVVAPCDGVTGRCDLHEGQLVQPGQCAVEVVDAAEPWITANYRETQLRHIHEGAEVTVTADAVPGLTFTGRVERLSDATGAAFSLIPQDNATGNFVKVEQRVPVRIALVGNRPEDIARLKAGLNVECEVKR